jgi:hypothetical protein
LLARWCSITLCFGTIWRLASSRTSGLLCTLRARGQRRERR